jgi:hypothetical protein
VFVPIGQGSGICACAAARTFTGAKSRIVGVVSAHATAYQQSFRAGRVIEAPVTTLLADGMACRLPDAQALDIMRREVDDRARRQRRRGGGRDARAFLPTPTTSPKGRAPRRSQRCCRQRQRWAGAGVGVTISGGNVDSDLFARVLAGLPDVAGRRCRQRRTRQALRSAPRGRAPGDRRHARSRHSGASASVRRGPRRQARAARRRARSAARDGFALRSGGTRAVDLLQLEPSLASSSLAISYWRTMPSSSVSCSFSSRRART